MPLDAVAYRAYHSAGGRGFTQAGVDDIFSGCFWVRGICRVCRGPVFKIQIQGNRDSYGAGRFRQAAWGEAAAGALLVSGISFLGGMVLGTPLAFCIWKLFCIFLVNTDETSFSIGVQAYGISVCYALVCMVLLIFMGILFIRQTDVIAIVHNERKCEPVRDVKPWYGWAGILLMILGGVCGYMTPTLCLRLLNWYCPAWINVTYLPLFVGLYMLLLYIVVHGRKKGKKRWRDIITGSMMKFQGRQTVNSMLVITVLLAARILRRFIRQ